jgi:hypothetical protein
MSTQRYVSPELTHFVGKNLTEDEQYSVLVNSILKPGWLKHDPSNSNPKEIGDAEALVSESRPRNDTEAMYSPVVCFCDIPVTDLEIHMNKYSRFGLSFLKPFLVDKGANPVMYVANNSPALALALPHFLTDSESSERFWPRREIFERSIELHWEWGTQVPPQYYLTVNNLLRDLVFPFIKFFDDSTSDEDAANVYMEREWRVLGDVKFALSDVHRVFMPQHYAERFRAELPTYVGQLTFSDSI